MKTKLELTEADVDSLVPYANNARIHSASQIDAICDSILSYGFNDPIGVWHNEDGELEIVEGHGRVLALHKLGIKKCPVVVLDHLTDEQRRAYCIVHNATTDCSMWDFEILDSVANEMGFDLSRYGIETDADIDSLFEEPNKTSGKTVLCPHCGERVVPRKEF